MVAPTENDKEIPREYWTSVGNFVTGESPYQTACRITELSFVFVDAMFGKQTKANNLKSYQEREEHIATLWRWIDNHKLNWTVMSKDHGEGWVIRSRPPT